MGSGVLWLMGVPGYFDVDAKLMYSSQATPQLLDV